ncbi:MAG TPA: endonuclease/exonuclease/phosphatase family protein [Thermoanaerobaculia bacterium]|nr:endonuclease/exonuclease/phosphatase family protein [Thermoanaerobaculia bacterium]
MGTLKITSWNVEHLDRLVAGDLSDLKRRRRDAVVAEIRELDSDVLCVQEGPKGEAGIDAVTTDLLGGDWVAVEAADGKYGIRGSQWIWFLVKQELAAAASLLPTATWDAFCGESWRCNFWGEFEDRLHRHYRHPQVLVLDDGGQRVELVGLHLKSKFVNRGESLWKGTEEERRTFIRKALEARVKMTTEAINVRRYVDAKFLQVESPAVFVLGDLNDGPGKEFFEERYLFLDLISNVQGSIFEADKFLNHALFDAPDDLRWSVTFKDFVQPERDPHILLDHILFTQPLVNGSLPWRIDAHAGLVEHEIHELVNATLPKSARTSDHTPVSVRVTTAN